MPSFVRRSAGAYFALMSLVSAGVAHARPCWHPPVTAPVVDPFREPECRWCPGNRGIEYGTARGRPVTAVATGRVTFAGSIAGTVYVVVRHGDGLRVTYGDLLSQSSDVGDLVVRGATLGQAGGNFHFGVRTGERYVDPAPYLGQLVRRPRLIPNDRTLPNPSPPPRLRCDDQA